VEYKLLRLSGQNITMNFPIAPIVFSSCGSFLGLAYLLKKKSFPKYLKDPGRRNAWLWRNTFCSLIHSCASAMWTFFCYYDEPKLLGDMVNTTTNLSIQLLSFSTGYFMYDFLDVVLNDGFRQVFILTHHTAVITAFSLALTNERYMGFGVCALIMEFNSIFLHIRRLMKLVNHSSGWKSINGVFLLLTMLFCRICLSCWMVRWLLQNRDLLQYSHYVVGLVGMVIMTVTNVGLMYRLWMSDFHKKSINKKVLSEIKK